MPTLHANGVELHYEEAGGGDAAILLLPGGGAPLEMWAAFRPRLEAGARVVTLDQRGVGRSTIPTEPWTIADMADDAKALLDHLGIQRAAVVGMSLGGAIAQELALRHPESVERLILISTVPHGTDAAGPYLRKLWEATEALDAAGLTEARALLMVLSMASRKTLMDEAFATQFLGVAAAVAHPHGQIAALATFDALDRLPSISVPTLVVVGADDVTCMPRQAELIADGIPGARLVVVPDAGHLLLHEHTDLMASMLADELLGAGEVADARR